VTTVTALAAAADDEEENEADGREDEDDDGEGDGDDDEKEERREEETADSRGSAADIASVTAAAATTTTIRIDHDQLYRLRVFHILPTNAQVGGGVVTHATVGQQQLIGRPIASTAVIAPALYVYIYIYKWVRDDCTGRLQQTCSEHVFWVVSIAVVFAAIWVPSSSSSGSARLTFVRVVCDLFTYFFLIFLLLCRVRYGVPANRPANVPGGKRVVCRGR